MKEPQGWRCHDYGRGKTRMDRWMEDMRLREKWGHGEDQTGMMWWGCGCPWKQTGRFGRWIGGKMDIWHWKLHFQDSICTVYKAKKCLGGDVLFWQTFDFFFSVKGGFTDNVGNNIYIIWKVIPRFSDYKSLFFFHSLASGATYTLERFMCEMMNILLLTFHMLFSH